MQVLECGFILSRTGRIGARLSVSVGIDVRMAVDSETRARRHRQSVSGHGGGHALSAGAVWGACSWRPLPGIRLV